MAMYGVPAQTLLGPAPQMQQGRRSMTALQSLLWPIWQEEERGKEHKLGTLRAKIGAWLQKRQAKLTPMQEKIKGWVGDLGEINRRTDEMQSSVAQIQAAQLQSQAMTQALVARNQAVNQSGSVWHSAAQGALVTVTGWHPHGPYHMSMFLQSIQQEKGRIHRYDDDASNITDARLIEQEVPLLWVISYCLCNNTAPEMGIMILENSGFTLIEEHDDP